MHTMSVSIDFLSAALDPLRQCGNKVRHLLEPYHLTLEQLDQSASRIPCEHFADIIRDAMLASGDEQLGHGAALQPLGSWSTMSQLCISADNLQEALRRLARFYRLVPWGIRTRLEIGTQQSAFVMEKAVDHPFSPYIFESFLLYVHRFSHWLIDRQIPMTAINFCFSPGPTQTEYPHLFPTSRVRFNQGDSRFVFPSRYLKEPVRQDTLSLDQFLAHPNRALLVQLYQHQSWQTQVQLYLQNRLASDPDISEVAAGLGVHPHTLRSRLRSEGFQFQDIKNRLRCDTAINLLSQESLSIERIADRLGFSETSAFSRAFKNWAGVPPNEYRRRQKSGNH